MFVREKRVAFFLLLAFTLPFLLSIGARQGEARFRHIFGNDYQEELAIIEDILGVLEYNYVEEVDREKLIEGAIKGLLDSLDDPYTHYMSPRDYEDLQIRTKGTFSGIGITVSPDEEEVIVVSPIKGSPGDKAGLKTGDRIVEIDGTPTRDISFNSAVDMMRGEEGTVVELHVERENVEELLHFEITRAVITIPNVEGEYKGDGLGYIRLNSFNDGTGRELAMEIALLEEAGMKGMILDLRYNPGGLLNEAVDVVSNFLATDEDVVHVKDRHGIQNSYHTTQFINSVDLPLVVMVNEGSASGSEIVAGALQDHGRAYVVGTQTFGKGVVQSIIPLRNGGAVSVTTSSYYTPSMRSIHDKGIEPDEVIELDLDEEDDELLSIDELDEDMQLERALEILRKLLDGEGLPTEDEAA